jgi:hypothetical protein
MAQHDLVVECEVTEWIELDHTVVNMRVNMFT